MSGWKDWAIGEVVTESDFQSFIQDQVVQRYADATDRDNTLGANVAEGMIAYTENDNSIQYYDGSVWQVLSTGGDITAVVAGTALTGGGTSGSVTVNADVSALATAHAGNALNANGDLLDVDESAITVAQSQVTDLVSDLADKADNADFTGGTAGYTALSNGTAGLSYQPVSHNYIINGAFDIWQRGDGPVALPDGGFLADRFRLFAASTNYEVSKSTDTPDNFDFSTKLQRDSGSSDTGQVSINYIPEDAGRILAGKEFTISFYAKVGADFSGALRFFVFSTSAEPQNINRFASGAMRNDTNPDYDEAIAIGSLPGLTTSWQRFSYTATLDSVANGVQFFMNQVSSGTAGADDSFYTTGWQLEAGSIATPFKRNANSIQGELAACQRYYQRYGQGVSTSGYVSGSWETTTRFIGLLSLVQKLRAIPSFDSSGTQGIRFKASNFTATNVLNGVAALDVATLFVDVASGGVAGEGAYFRNQGDADAYIEFDAEL